MVSQKHEDVSMREAELKRRRHAEVLANCPMCIYCGGAKPATTIDHMPPIGMFHGRRRPKGLEFASCESCNHGTKTAELVAALTGRLYPDAVSGEQKAEMRRLFQAITNNVPGLIEEMHIGTAGQEIERRRTGIAAGGGFMRASGPLVSKFMQMFAVKFGFALHYHTT